MKYNIFVELGIPHISSINTNVTVSPEFLINKVIYFRISFPF